MKSKDLERQALQLLPHERARLVWKLLLSLEGLSAGDLRAAWLSEVGRRAAALDRGEVEPVPADEVRRKARALLR
jgi:putative addiction module component (TIGR02574 family)